MKVSIHAPARGATMFDGHRKFPCCFNPRARAGRDQVGTVTIPNKLGFNPRARAGRDVSFAEYLTKLVVSIHAPARGATLRLSGCQIRSRFQSTRPRGARHCRAG